MTLDPTKITIPPTELELAELLTPSVESVELTDEGRMVIRRLAFQKDFLIHVLKKIESASITECPTNDPFTWLQEIAGRGLPDER